MSGWVNASASYYVELTSQGKFLVYFNETVYSCKENSNCPPNGVCYINQTWSALPAMCACSLSTGMKGYGCAEWTSWGILFFFTYLLCEISCFFILMFAIFDLIASRNEIIRHPLSAFSTTLILNTLAVVSLSGYAGVYLARQFAPKNDLAMQIFLAGVYLFLR